MSLLGALWNRFHRHRHMAGDWSLPIEADGLADGAVTSAKILDGTIVNADVSSSAAIAIAKLADGVEAVSYTPTLKGSSTAGSFVYALQSGRYARIGPVVVATFTVNVSSVSSGGTGNVVVSLPVVASNQSNLYGACAVEVSNVNLSAGYSYVTGRIAPGASEVGLYQSGDNIGVAALDAASIAASYQVLGTVVYLAG